MGTCDRKKNKVAAKKKSNAKCDADKKDCPLAHLIAIVKTSKGEVVGQAQVALEGKEGGGDTDASTGKHDFGKIDPETYEVVASKKCHKPDQAKKSVTLAAGEEKEVELVLDPYPIKIKSVKASYTVVLDKDGNEVTAHPILEFEVTDGPPDHKIDIQLSRDAANGLSGGPGLSGAWDPAASRDDRVGKKLYSSWTNGDTSLKLDGSGKAKYKMPLEWWRDLARMKRSDFDKKDFYYRVVALEDGSSTPCAMSSPDGGASAPKLEVKNNVTMFRVVDLGYGIGDITKSARVEFTVREANTTEMYTMVQWMQGSFRLWRGKGSAVVFPGHKLYNIKHDANFPDRTIDSLTTNPRPTFFGGAGGPSVSTDGKTARGTDAPNPGSISAPFTHYYTTVDFESQLHLNFEVPDAVRIIRQDGSAPKFGVITGDLPPPEPVILDSDTWDTRVLQVRSATGTVTTTHPASFGGP